MRALVLLAVALAGGLTISALLRLLPLLLDRYREAFAADARHRMDAFFLALDLSRLWLPALLVGLAVGVGVYVWLGSVPLALMLCVLTLCLPRWLAHWAWTRRARRFEAQLPEFLLALAWALRAGASLPGALRALVEEAPAPLRQEFSLMLREQRMGLSFEQALAGLSQRLPLQSLILVTAVLGIAAQTGGQVADTVQGLAETLSRQQRVQAKLRSVTAQSVLQARVMGALPVLLLLALQRLEPAAMHGLWHTPTGWGVLILLALLLGAGTCLIRRQLRLPS